MAFFGSFPVFDWVTSPGDITLDPYEPTSPTWLWARAGGAFTGVFEDGTSVDDFDPYLLRSLWATGNTTDVTFRGPNLPDGPVGYLFPALRHVWLDSSIPGSPEIGTGSEEVDGTSLLFQNFGGDHFAPYLRNVHASATATVDVRFENNRQQDGNGVNLDVFGDGYMKSLRSIKVTSRDENADVSILNDGGNDFMPELRTISIRAKEFVDLDISPSVNPSPLTNDSLGNGFMRSLKSIHVVAEEANADMSLSYSGGADFMQSLKSIYIHGGGTDEIVSPDSDEGVSLSFSVDPVFEGTETVEYLPSLKTITALSDEGELTVSISVAGDTLFMPSLQHIFIKGTDHYRVVDFSISHDVVVEDEAVAAFMQSLKTIKVVGENAGASISISLATEAMYFQSLEDVYVAGDGDSNLNIGNGAADYFAPLISSLKVSMGELRDVFETTPGAEILLRNRLIDDEFADAPGDVFMMGLRTIELRSIGLAELELQNGLFETSQPISAVGGDYFLLSLETIDVEAGLDADVILHTDEDNAFLSLTSVNVVAQQPDVLTPDEITVILDANLFEANRALSEIIIDGEDTTNSFSALEIVDVKVLGEGPLGLDNEGSIFAHFESIASAGFDVVLETNGEGDIEVEANDTPGLQTLTLTGEDMASVLLTGTQTSFALLDLTGMAIDSETTADMTGAAFGGGFEVRLGSGDLEYEAAAVTETFVFTDSTLGTTLNFGGFDTGDPAFSGDLLDLSALGVTGLGELTIDDSGADLLISSNAFDFTGTIVLEGVDNAGDVTDDNFIFL